MKNRTITAAQREELAGWLNVAKVIQAGLDQVYERALQITQEECKRAARPGG